MHSTRQDIVEVRVNENPIPVKQVKTKVNRWYRSQNEELKDAQDLLQCIAQAKQERERR